MSVRPGISVVHRSTPPPRSSPTDTGVWFVTGLTDAGPLVPTLVQSMADYERLFGLRVSYSVLYDTLDTYFREGGARVYVSRVVGPAAVVATKNLLDSGAVISLVATALGPGASGNAIKVGVRAGSAGGTFVIFVQDATNAEVETSPDLVDNQTAVNWASNSSYIRLALGASANDPAVAAAAALATGDDDRANITDAQWQAALDRITTGYGTGQVSAPGRTSDVGHTQLLAHAAVSRRVAILDGVDTATAGTLRTSVNSARAGNQRFGGMWGPWLVVPGVIAGTTRTVPPSALVAGLLARNDGVGIGPDTPAAGENGTAQYVIGLSQPDWSGSDRQTLNDAGFSAIRRLEGQIPPIRVYGWRTLVDPVVDPDWRNFGNARLYMAIAAEGARIAEGFVFSKIDGQGKTIAAFGGALSAMLQRFWNSGDLYGLTAADAFFVDVGPQVNTLTRLANLELHAVLNVKMSPDAEFVQIEVYKRPITEGVS